MSRPVKPQSAQAVEMVLAGATPYAAAKAHGLAQSTVLRAVARHHAALAAERCPTCGQIVKL